MMEWIHSARKTIINVCTLVVAVGTPVLAQTTGWLPENVAYTISAVVSVSGIILHYLVPNTTTDPNVALNQSVALRPEGAYEFVKVAA